MTGKQRLTDSERKKMLVAYLKDGSVPEGFYVKLMKNDNISFRRHKPALNNEEKIRQLERRIEKLKQADRTQINSDSSSSDKTEENEPLSEMPSNPVPEEANGQNPQDSEEAKPKDDDDW